MSLFTLFPAAILETVLTGLIELFLAGANGDPAAARHAAAHMLGGYHPRTEDELRLAANIVAFSFQALRALGQAAAPDIPLARALRLNGSAVSLSREAAKAERSLAQLRKAPQQAVPAQVAQPQSLPLATQPPEIQPKVEAAPASSRDSGKILAIARANGISWTQAYKMHQRGLRIAAKRSNTQTTSRQDPGHSNPAGPPLGQHPVAQAV